MKIGFDAKRAFHNSRGLGHYSRTLIKNLSKYHSDNEYVLFTPPLKENGLSEWHQALSSTSVVEPRSILSQKLSSTWRSLFLSNVIKKYDLDIYHGLSHEIPPMIGSTGVKSVVTVHDLIFMRFPQFFPWIDRQVYWRKFYDSCKRADRVVAICEQTKKDIVDYLHCPADKIEVVYQSCSDVFIDAPRALDSSPALKKYGIDDRYIFYVGALEKNKNVISLVKGYADSSIRKSTKLVIGGKPSKYSEMLKLEVQQLGIEDRVIFTGMIPDEDMPALYQNASAFCFPSFYEGFGIPIIESLFSGTPVITTAGGAFAEAGGPGALYVDPYRPETIKERLEELFGSSDLQKELVQKGSEHIQKFRQEETAKKLNDLYRNLTLL